MLQCTHLYNALFIIKLVLFTCNIRNADVHLSVESAESPEGSVDAVGPVGGRHDDDMGALLEAVHESEQLGDDATLHLPVGLGGELGRE